MAFADIALCGAALAWGAADERCVSWFRPMGMAIDDEMLFGSNIFAFIYGSYKLEVFGGKKVCCFWAIFIAFVETHVSTFGQESKMEAAAV